MYQNYKLLIMVIFFGCFSMASKANDTIPFIQPGDSLFVEHFEGYGNIIRHKIKPKQTLYSLSKFYGVTVFDLYDFNPSLSKQVISVGEEIIVPVFNLGIHQNISSYKKDMFVPLCYKVKAKENLFRISKYYFEVDATAIKKLNNLEKDGLSIDQVIQIGWIKINQVNSRRDTADQNLMATKFNSFNEKFEFDASEKEVMTEKGAAIWNKLFPAGDDLLVLHRTAKPNTIVEVYNPMTKAKIYAKVISNIPPNAYTREVKLIVSPSVANLLGALDSRFFVRIRYFKD